ncbi:MAG TPA: 4'-phosphopantetheinyl transferase superfamily protein [Polyangiaceae bacterium]|nr:4'-phosphopantetheinyl transferase superfamily protein [Polyangiaceae bacterium]
MVNLFLLDTRAPGITVPTHAFVRACLAACSSHDPAAFVFARGPLGKPEIRAPRDAEPLHFNVSKTHELVVCAVARGHGLGVDVEYLTRNVRMLDIAHRYFAPEEARALARLPCPVRAFHALWTLKEAYAKGLGLGLTMPLDRCTFDIASDGQVDTRKTPCGDWQFGLWTPTPEHVLALALPCEAGPIDVRFHRFKLQAMPKNADHPWTIAPAPRAPMEARW